MNSIVRNRILSLDEANKMLPLIKKIATDIQTTWVKILAGRHRHQQIEEALRCNHADHDLTDVAEIKERGKEIRTEVDTLVDRINRYIQEVENLGCYVEEYKRGVINFPSLYIGRKIFLCWALTNDDDEVVYWHELDESYNDRRGIRDKQDFLVPGDF